MAGNGSGSARRVVERIDGNGIYGSRAASAGPWIFFSGTAVNPSGRSSGVESLPAGYRDSLVAQARSQAHYVFSRFGEALAELGSSLENVLQIEHYIEWKVQHDGFLEVSRGKEFMARNRPGSLLLEAGSYLPGGSAFAVNGMALIPTEGVPGKEIFRTDLSYAAGKHRRPGVGLDPEKYPQFYEDASEEAPFSEVVTAGPYVFNTVYASDYQTGPHPDVKVGAWSSWGSEMRNEAMWMGMALDKKLAAGGTSLDNVVHCSVFLNEMDDLYELDLVWAKLFPKDPPARTVVPIKGLGQPRHEGAKHHWEGSPKMEIQFRSMREGFGADRQVISLPGGALPTESSAVRVGDLLWIGGQVAADLDGPVTPGDIESQLDYIFDRIGQICEEGSTSLDHLLRIRAFVTDEAAGYAFYRKLKERIPQDPPAVGNIVIPDSVMPGISVTVDAVAYVP